jgi:hypothetical protein
MGGVSEVGAEPIVLQQINLYRIPHENSMRKRSARFLVLVCVVVVGALVLLFGAGQYHLATVEEQRAVVAGELAERRAALAKLQDKLQPPQLDPFLEAERSALRLRQRHLNESLSALSRQQSTESVVFSSFFAGLARNPVEGLWFQSVSLSAGGEQVVLRGKTVDPALVPRLLQQLAAEQAFSGRTFRRANLQRSSEEAETRFLDFELRTAETGELHDAG